MIKLKYMLVLVVFLFSSIRAITQTKIDKEKEWFEKGSVSGKIFANFHTSGSDAGKQNAFEVNRAYFGYTYKIDNNFSTNAELITTTYR